MQRNKNSSNIVKAIVFIAILIVSTISIYAAEEEKTTTQSDLIEQKIQEYENLGYSTIIANSIDSDIAARAAFDQAFGYMKIAEFKRDYEIVPPKPEEKKATAAETNFGAKILKFVVNQEKDSSVSYEAEIKLLATDKQFSYNLLIVSNTDDELLLFDSPQEVSSPTDLMKEDNARIINGKITKDLLDRKHFNYKEGLKYIEFRFYNSKEFDELLTEQRPFKTEEQELAVLGAGTEFKYEFIESRKIVFITIENFDQNDKYNYYYQFEFNTEKGKSYYPKETRLSRPDIEKEKNLFSIDYGYINIKSPAEVKSIVLNAHFTSISEEPLYAKTMDSAEKAELKTTCKSCNDNTICTYSECKGTDKNCIWTADESLWKKIKNSAPDWTPFISAKKLNEWKTESGFCKTLSQSTPEEQCLDRCQGFSKCEGLLKQDCIKDTKCILEDDKCIPNPEYGKAAITVPRTTQEKLKQLKAEYGDQIKESARVNKIGEALIYAIILSEAAGGVDPRSISPTGCVGLMQICDTEALSMPDIFDKNKIDKSCTKSKCSAADPRFDGKLSIQGGTRIFANKRKLFGAYSDQEKFTIASYNIGEGVVLSVLKRLGKDAFWDEVIKEMKTSDLKTQKVYSGWSEKQLNDKITGVKVYVQRVIDYQKAAEQMPA